MCHELVCHELVCHELVCHELVCYELVCHELSVGQAQRWRSGGTCHARLIPVRVHYTLDCFRKGCWETRAEADSERCRDKLKRFRVYGLGFRGWALLTAEERGMSASTGLLA